MGLLGIPQRRRRFRYREAEPPPNCRQLRRRIHQNPEQTVAFQRTLLTERTRRRFRRSDQVCLRYRRLPSLARRLVRLPCFPRILSSHPACRVLYHLSPLRSECVHTRPAPTTRALSERRNVQWDEEVAGEDIIVKVTERRWRMKLAGRDPSVRIGPLPADC